MSHTPSNPNNCRTCDHMPDPAKVGHCYMWKTAPTGTCWSHTNIRKGQHAAMQALVQLSRMIPPEKSKCK